jgi:hypothetical protein
VIVEEKEGRWRRQRSRPAGAAEGMREDHGSRDERESRRGEATEVRFGLYLS